MHWEPSPHAFPSPGRSLWDVSSARGTLLKISRHWSVKMRGTVFVSGNASPTWQPAEPEHPDTAPFAQCSLRSHGEQPGWGCSCPLLGLCGMHVCSSRSPARTMLRCQLCSPASCRSRCTLLMKVFRRVWFYLWLSSKRPSVKKPHTCGPGCLTLGLSFKFKL